MIEIAHLKAYLDCWTATLSTKRGSSSPLATVPSIAGALKRYCVINERDVTLDYGLGTELLCKSLVRLNTMMEPPPLLSLSSPQCHAACAHCLSLLLVTRPLDKRCCSPLGTLPLNLGKLVPAVSASCSRKVGFENCESSKLIPKAWLNNPYSPHHHPSRLYAGMVHVLWEDSARMLSES